VLIAPHPFSASSIAGQAHLRILQTTDLHAHILPFDYYHDRPNESVGLARTAALIAKARAKSPNTVLFDNGDLLQGSALGDYIAYDRGLKDGDLHPVIAAMNALKYDAAALGNHEFNYGVPFLMAALGRSAFPFVSANAVTKKGANPRRDKRLLPPYVILERMVRDGAGVMHPLRIGVLGLLPPQIVTWDETALRGGIQARDMVETATALIPEMREAGADIIVALAHTGIGEAQHNDGMENAGRPLARLPGIDALVTGHAHMLFPSVQFANTPGIDLAKGTVDGTPTAMAGFWGSHLGVIDLLLERRGTEWAVLDGTGHTLPISKLDQGAVRKPLVTSVPQVIKATKAAHEATLDYMRFAVGETQKHLHSFFALVQDCLSVQLICKAQERFMRQQFAGTAFADLPLLSAAAPFKVGGYAGPGNYTFIPPGPLAQRNIADLYCFPNTICALRLRGADIVEWLERSAAMFHQVQPEGQDQPLLNDAFPSYNFDIIMGLTYEIDPTQPSRYSVTGALINPEARRIRNLRYQGQAIDPEAEFLMATNNYRASTQSALAASDTVKTVFEASVTLRNILLNAISAFSPLILTIEENWRFVPMPGASFVFESSPLAEPFLRAGGVIEPAGMTAQGFGLYRLRG
jgi:2',3'-cyclic-nucleotide 2'-phosphodiesterase/3'-nucleotidase